MLFADPFVNTCAPDLVAARWRIWWRFRFGSRLGLRFTAMLGRLRIFLGFVLMLFIVHFRYPFPESVSKSF